MPTILEPVRTFVPELWCELDRFSVFWPTTYAFRGHEKRVLAGVKNHAHKAVTLLAIAESLVPDLEIDHAQLEARGFTPAQHATNLAAVLEGVITELYSVVDCTARVLHNVYGPTSRNYRESTSRLFERVDAIEGSFPDRLKAAIRNAAWYPELRSLRDELTHRDTGSCSKDHETGIVRYFHSSLWEGERMKPIDDIFGWIRTHMHNIDRFVDDVFNELNQSITSGTVTQVCGFVEGRILMRLLDASQPADFDNGTCLSAQWFAQPGNPYCPFTAQCGAFQRRATDQQLREVYGRSDPFPND